MRWPDAVTREYFRGERVANRDTSKGKRCPPHRWRPKNETVDVCTKCRRERVAP